MSTDTLDPPVARRRRTRPDPVPSVRRLPARATPVPRDAPGSHEAPAGRRAPVLATRPRGLVRLGTLVARIAAHTATRRGAHAAAAVKSLRTTVLHGLDAHRCNGVLVTGTTAKVGKSTVAINLAAAIARAPGQRVILVELDLRAPSIAHLLGIEGHSGVEGAARGGFDARASLVSVPELGIEVLACARVQEDSSELLASPRFARLLRALERTDAVIVYDAPPAIGCDDVAAIVPSMGAALIVIEEGRTTRAELALAREALGATPLLSIVLNRCRSAPFARYHYPSTAAR